MRIFNTLTGQEEEFQPFQNHHVRMYTCGPTVYNFAHIGNFRTFVCQDLLRRWLLYRGYRLTHVMNVTDVDDKTITNAKAAGLSLKDYTTRYADAFFEDCRHLRLQQPEVIPYATDHIEEMVQLVEKLMEKNLAYRQNGSIYYRISAFTNYGRLSRLDPSQLQIGHSIEADEYSKDNPRDFVLWKAPKDGEPYWETRIGPGRPGWHLECSAMSMKYLGETFDLHCGGVDLIFPHHENEIAQSEGATGRTFVKYWFHSEHLLVNGERMAKSKGNFYTLRDLLEKGFDSIAIRYLLLSTHYQKPLNFTLEGVGQATGALQTLKNFLLLARTCRQAPSDNPRVVDIAEHRLRQFESAMDDNLNISAALAAVYDARYDLNAIAESQGLSSADREKVLLLFQKFNSLLDVLDFEADVITDAEVLQLIEERGAARRNHDFMRADEIRAQLLQRGIALEDTRDGVRWKRTR
ncbi:MAG: cysteine--tRNA ligase [Acidobacteria bacterium]|nr:cysteine--tRNA ligase [Acidobacteriota bacterium]